MSLIKTDAVIRAANSMSDFSILFLRPADSPPRNVAEPAYFHDLNLDQLVTAIVTDIDEYDLKLLFYTPLHTLPEIEYRQEIVRDLSDPMLAEGLGLFVKRMESAGVNRANADQARHRYQKARWSLDAADEYCEAVTSLARNLSESDLHSRGLRQFREHLASYVGSEPFASLTKQTAVVKASLSAIRYCILIKDNTVTVRQYNGEPDYRLTVDQVFTRFRRTGAKDYRIGFPALIEMNHVEEKIVECVARLYPVVFRDLESYAAAYWSCADPMISRFQREIQFYLTYLEFTKRLIEQGLSFCLPAMTTDRTRIYAFNSFDIALAAKLTVRRSIPITNDLDLSDPERIIVVSGPNQGGKTTFARTFGQINYLASLGLAIPGTKARLSVHDRLLTHFQRPENALELRGGLEDELIRIHEILSKATGETIIIVNEIFGSTTLRDAVDLGTRTLERITNLDALCMWVTFIDELSALNGKIVSMVSSVVPEDPSKRTFKIERGPANALAWAISLAEKHNLTYDRLKKRLQ